MKVFTLVFLLNLITCFIARLLHGGRLIVDDDKGSWFNTKIYFIAGILNQPIRAFHYFSYRGFCRVYLNYSVFGFNPKRAGKQLDKLMKDGDVVCGVSIGAKPIAYSTTNGFKRVLINPCTHPEILQPKYFWLIRIFAPLFKLLTFLLGWISILPLISAEGGRYSLALLADQLFWIGYGYPGDTNDDNNTPDLGD